MNVSETVVDFVKLYRDKKIIICGHESPDVDSTSSQFALQFLLQKLGIREVYSVKQEDFL
jgi:nanoRNase/pAp phosphatase (c-di-AMP/oligoRNAs hydrolase)